MKVATQFCGSYAGASAAQASAAAALEGELVGAGLMTDCGGTHKSLMGVLADAVFETNVWRSSDPNQADMRSNYPPALFHLDPGLALPARP
jgi:hypothetical protein